MTYRVKILFSHLVPLLGMPNNTLTHFFWSKPNTPLFAHSVAAGKPEAGSWSTAGFSRHICYLKEPANSALSQLILHKIAMSGLAEGKHDRRQSIRRDLVQSESLA